MPSYIYEDEDGEPSFRVVRRGDGKNKSFYQQHPNGNGWAKGLDGATPVPYHLPLVLACIEYGSSEVWITEGEKDADNAINAYDIVATTNSGGAGKWRDAHSKFLVGAECVNIVVDLDDEGRRHAWEVHDSLRRVGVQDIRFYRAREGKDISDHIAAGYGLRDLKRFKPARSNKENVEREPIEHGELLPAAFQLALMKLRELGPVKLEDADSQQYNALCPAHDDKNPSMTIRPGTDGDEVTVLVHCFTGCSSDEIAVALDIDPREFTVEPGKTFLDQDVEREYTRMKARKEAARMIAEEVLNAEPTDWSNAKSGEDELKIPLEPVQFLIDDWFAYGTFTLMVADPKAGKTRLTLNLMQALTEKQPFLGKYDTSMADDSRVLYLNYDMPENLFRTYLKDYNWQASDRFVVQHLLAGQFPFWESIHFDKFVDFALGLNVQTLIIDTFAVASQGFVTDENSNTEVSAFCAEVKKLKAAASIPNVLMLHHRGRSKDEHGRGASAFDAAVDALWFLRMTDREDFESPRSLRAIGRNVGQSAVELAYNLAEERYTTDGKPASKLSQASSSGGLSGKARVTKLSKFAGYCKALKVYYDEHGYWPSAKVAYKMVPGDKNQAGLIRDEALSEGLTERVDVVGRTYRVGLTADGLAAVNAGS